METVAHFFLAQLLVLAAVVGLFQRVRG